MTNEPSTMDITKILDFLPHRYPFLLVDRVLEYKTGSYIKAIKNVTFNEPFFQGHFPNLPVMPGVLVLEALAQAGGLLIRESMGDDFEGKIFMFTGIEKVRFRRPVRPGDRLVLECEDIRQRMTIVKMDGKAMVDDELVAQGTLSAAVIDRESVL